MHNNHSYIKLFFGSLIVIAMGYSLMVGTIRIILAIAAA